MDKSKQYNPLSAVMAYMIGNMMIKAIPFVTLPIFTRVMSTADFGLYNTYLSYENILSILLGFGLCGTIRVAKIQYGDSFEKYVSAIYGLQITLSFVVDIIIILAFTLLQPKIWISQTLLMVLLVNCLSTQLYSIASAKYAISGEVVQNLIISFLMTFFNVCLSLILCIYVYKNDTYIGRILGTCGAAIIVALIVLLQQVKRSVNLIDVPLWKFGLKMGAPLILHSLSVTVLSQCDKIMIQSIVGNEEAGIYGIAVTLSGIVAVLVTSIDNAWAPWYFERLKEKKYNYILNCNNVMIGVFSLFSACVMFISPEIIRIMSTKEYWDSIYSFSPILVSIVFNFIYLIPVNFEYYNKQTSFVASSTIVSVVINVVLNYLFIKKIGYIGAAYATLLSKFVLMIMHWRKAWKIEQVHLMSISKVIFWTMFSVITCMLSIVLCQNLIARYVIVIVIVIIAIIYLKKNYTVIKGERL